MPPLILIDEREDVQWLRDVHLPGMPGDVKAAMVFGNEDSPDKIVTFEVQAPTLGSVGTIYYPDGDGVFFQATHRTPNPAPPQTTETGGLVGRLKF